MSACTRPVLDARVVAGRAVVHCESCGSWSPPGAEAADEWSAQHRQAATLTNTDIDTHAAVGASP